MCLQSFYYLVWLSMIQSESIQTMWKRGQKRVESRWKKPLKHPSIHASIHPSIHPSPTTATTTKKNTLTRKMKVSVHCTNQGFCGFDQTDNFDWILVFWQDIVRHRRQSGLKVSLSHGVMDKEEALQRKNKLVRSLLIYYCPLQSLPCPP